MGGWFGDCSMRWERREWKLKSGLLKRSEQEVIPALSQYKSLPPRGLGMDGKER
jgi:hypothetical protein